MTARSILPFLLLILPGRCAAEAPNVLLIVSDDLQACLGCYGHEVCRTPHIDRLAREGVRFERAYCQYPVCGPSRASFMSGLYPRTTTILGNSSAQGSFRAVNPRLAEHPSIGGFLREHGWFSARVSKIYHMGVPGGIERGDPGGDDPDSWDYAYDVMGPETLSPGVRELLSPRRNHYGSSFAVVRVPDERQETQTDHLATSQAIAILESRAASVIPGASNKIKQKPDAPFFLAVGLVRPHVPLVAPQRLFDRYPADDMTLPTVPQGDLDDVPRGVAAKRNGKTFGMTQDQQRRALAAYFASVTFMDEQVGRLLEALDRLELRRDTIVVFTADHGWNLGEHDCWQKMSFWEETTRVPLIVSSPAHRATAAGVNREIVELIDLYPTIGDLCGLADRLPEILEGRSLRPLLEKPGLLDPGRDALTVMGRNAKTYSLRTRDWRYSNYGGDEELYHLAEDPKEFTNLARDPAHSERLSTLRARAAARVGQAP